MNPWAIYLVSGIGLALWWGLLQVTLNVSEKRWRAR
jgi:hypothetical protein